MTPSDIFSQLVAVFNDWGGFLKDPQYVRDGCEIGWAGAVNTMMPASLTKRDTAELSRKRQFTFRITDDDSVIQINYRFLQTDVLGSARLAFYEVGTLMDDQELEVQPWSDEIGSVDPARWVRFDYCNAGLGRVLHMDSHLHISGFPDTRFAVTGIPTPKQFIEFIASHFYPATYQKHRLGSGQYFDNVAVIDGVNSAHMAPEHGFDEIYSRIPHFRMPGA